MEGSGCATCTPQEGRQKLTLEKILSVPGVQMPAAPPARTPRFLHSLPDWLVSGWQKLQCQTARPGIHQQSHESLQPVVLTCFQKATFYTKLRNVKILTSGRNWSGCKTVHTQNIFKTNKFSRIQMIKSRLNTKVSLN